MLCFGCALNCRRPLLADAAAGVQVASAGRQLSAESAAHGAGTATNASVAGARNESFDACAQGVNRGTFRMYDLGSPNLNLDEYGSATPPDYEPRRMRVPTALYYANSDWLAGRQDVEVRAASLHSPVAFRQFTTCCALLTASGCCQSWRRRRCRATHVRLRTPNQSPLCSTRSTSKATRTQTSYGLITQPASSTTRLCSSSAATFEQRWRLQTLSQNIYQYTRVCTVQTYYTRTVLVRT